MDEKKVEEGPNLNAFHKNHCDDRMKEYKTKDPHLQEGIGGLPEVV